MQGFTKEELITQLDESITDEGAVISYIGLQGEYLYLKYHIYDADGITEVEEHIRPPNHQSGVESTMIARKIV